jgi:uncharacterized coiled-coil protein SlyX
LPKQSLSSQIVAKPVTLETLKADVEMLKDRLQSMENWLIDDKDHKI